MDEPTAALGVEQQERVAELVRSVCDNGVPVLLISHNLPQVHKICDRVVVLFQGQVVADLRPAESSVDDIVAWITGAAMGGRAVACSRLAAKASVAMPLRLPSALTPSGPSRRAPAPRATPPVPGRLAGLGRPHRRLLDRWRARPDDPGVRAPVAHLFTRASWLNTSQYAVEFLLLAIGQTFVIITGGIDLSDGAILGFTGMVSGVVMQSMLSSHESSLAGDHCRVRGCAGAGGVRRRSSTVSSSPG